MGLASDMLASRLALGAARTLGIGLLERGEKIVRLSEPRVTPVEESDVEGEAKELLARTRGPTDTPRIFRTLVRHPKLLKRWLVFGNHILAKSTLPARERELAILRIGWLCRAEYEFAAHTRIGREVGLSEAELERVHLQLLAQLVDHALGGKGRVGHPRRPVRPPLGLIDYHVVAIYKSIIYLVRREYTLSSSRYHRSRKRSGLIC
mgnify:CR=1 FL=1